LPRSSKPQETRKKPRAAKGASGPLAPREGAPSAKEPGDDAEDRDTSEGDDGAEDTREDATEGTEGAGGGEGTEGDGPDKDDEAVEGESETEDEGDAPARLPPLREGASERGSIERFDPLAAYLREVQRHPLLSPEETQGLAQKRYDPYRGVKLSSYAAWWIRAYILRFILNNWRLVKLGTTQAQRKLFFNLRKKRAELIAMGIDPTHSEIAKQLNVPESEVAEMDVRLQSSEKSLDAPIGDGEGRATAKIDTMPSLVEGPETLLADNELQGLLKEKLGAFRTTLTGKEKELAIFDERLVADEPLTLQELGDRFGISRERVRQLEQRLTGRLREFLKEEMGDAVGVV
jgi:RNA polymerase sigma-32 factor